MAQGRASDILGPNVTLFSLGAGEGEGARDDRAGPRGARVSLTGIGGVGAARAGPWIESGGAASKIGVPLSRTWVEGRVLVCEELGFKVEELMVL